MRVSAVSFVSRMVILVLTSGCSTTPVRSSRAPATVKMRVEKIKAAKENDDAARKAHQLDLMRRHSNHRNLPVNSSDQIRAYSRAIQFQKDSSNGGRFNPHDALGFPNNLPALKWQSFGPYGANNDYGASVGAGRVEAVLYQEASKRIFLGTVSGGIWRGVWTTDTFDPTNVTYKAVSDHQSSLSIGALASDPKQPDTLYAVTGESSDFDYTYHSAGVLKSLDGGITWSRVDVWTPPLPNLFNGKKMSQIWVDPTDSSHLLTSVIRRGLFESHNAGITWTLKLQATSYIHFSYSADNKSLLLTTSDADHPSNIGIFYSKDFGGTFQTSQLTWSGSLPSTAIIKSSFSPVNPLVVWVSIAPSDDERTKMNSVTGLYRSEDGGASFTQELSYQNALYTEDNFGLNGYSMGVAASPTDPDSVFLAGMNAWSYKHGDASLVQKTAWDESVSGLPALHPDTHYMSSASGKLFVGNDGGTFVSTDEGTTWQGVNQGVSTFQIYKACLGGRGGFENIFAGMQDSGLAKPDSGNKTWSIISDGDGIDCSYDLQDPLAQTLYAANYNGYYYISGTSGADLTDLALLPLNANIGEQASFSAPIIVDQNDSSKFYGVGGRLYENLVSPQTILSGDFDFYDPNASTNFWRPIGGLIFPGDTNGIFQIAKVGPKERPVFYAVTAYGIARGVTELQNGSITNITWKAIQPPGDLTFTGIALHPNDPNLIVATAGGYTKSQIWKSSDAGATWTNIVSNYGNVNSPVNGGLFHFSPTRPNSKDLYIAGDHGVYFADVSIDSPVWVPVGSGIPNTIVMQVVLTPDQKNLGAVTFGRGIWTLSLPSDAQ